MPSWRDEYLSGLQERDRTEKANLIIYNAYMRLADHTANLHVLSAAGEGSKRPDRTPSILETGDALAQVRDDLAEAQRSRALLEARLHTMTDEDQKLKMQSSLDVKQIAELTKAKAALSTSVKDRDEELRGKAKLLEDIHDETVSLTLQLNMAEDQSRELRQENKQLVDRWMKRMGQEAEALNISSKFS